jgi:phosphoribosyl 1,2-cyclic phosphate phosphodiesterase
MLDSNLKVKFLGTGTSQGVPMIACECKVCKSDDIKDNRLRSSIYIEKNNTSIVIDTGPDFRQQMLNNNILELDAVIYTHEHKDHVAGLDDIRAFNHKYKKDMNIYCSDRVFTALEREYIYIFNERYFYPGIPKVNRHRIDSNIFYIDNIKIIPIEVMHYKLPVMGFRIDDFCYITDANFISDKEKLKMQDLDVLVINALRIQQHVSHFNLDESLELIRELKPKRAYLTHISHQLGFYADISKELPENVFLAYDGLDI